jgi:hypothetical protein
MAIYFFLLINFCVWYQEVSAEPPIMTVQPNGTRVYDIRNMYNFDIEDYLTEYAPHLLPYADDIEYWSIYARVDARILLVLMEFQTGVVMRPNLTVNRREDPFGDLTIVHGFKHQLISVAEVLKYRNTGDMVPHWFKALKRPKHENPFIFLNKLDPEDRKNRQRYDDLRFLFMDMFYLEFETIFKHRTQRWWERLLVKQ